MADITKIVDLKAPVSSVWRAVTDHREFGAWFRVELYEPFVVGKETRGHITYPGHEGVEWVSVTERMEPERVFAFSWHPNAVDPETDYSAEAKVVVEFTLEPTPDGTRLTITETGYDQIPEPRRLEALRSNQEGWNIQAGHIADYVEG